MAQYNKRWTNPIGMWSSKFVAKFFLLAKFHQKAKFKMQSSEMTLVLATSHAKQNKIRHIALY